METKTIGLGESYIGGFRDRLKGIVLVIFRPKEIRALTIEFTVGAIKVV